MFGFEIQDKYTLCRVGLTKFGIEPSGESSVRPSGTSLPFTSRYLTPLMEHSRNCISFSVKVPVLSVNTYSTCQRKIGRFTYLVCGKKKKKSHIQDSTVKQVNWHINNTKWKTPFVLAETYFSFDQFIFQIIFSPYLQLHTFSPSVSYLAEFFIEVWGVDLSFLVTLLMVQV